MERSQGNFFYRNIANAVSILGVLPMALLFMEDGYRYLIPLIIYNNVMDDLDGVLAGKLNIRSRFGADLDNLCDAVSHVILILMIGAHFEGAVLIASLIAASTVMVRLTSRLNPDMVKGGGSPTNELMRHMLFVLLLTSQLDVNAVPFLVSVFLLNSITMLVPFKLSGLIRSRASSAIGVALVNVLLVIAWLIPTLTPFIAAAFFLTYLYASFVGGTQWLGERKNRTSLSGNQ